MSGRSTKNADRHACCQLEIKSNMTEALDPGDRQPTVSRETNQTQLSSRRKGPSDQTQRPRNARPHARPARVPCQVELGWNPGRDTDASAWPGPRSCCPASSESAQGREDPGPVTVGGLALSSIWCHQRSDGIVNVSPERRGSGDTPQQRLTIKPADAPRPAGPSWGVSPHPPRPQQPRGLSSSSCPRAGLHSNSSR